MLHTTQMSSQRDRQRPQWMTLLAAFALLVGAITLAVSQVRAQSATPSVRLVPAPLMAFSADSDSNSPAIWERLDGVPRMFLLTSVAGVATRHSGSGLSTLSTSGPVLFSNHPGHGVWFEAIVGDVDGTWYGYYHQERPAEVCAESLRTIPRIGAARSRDHGATWEDLGVVVEAPPGSHVCASTNQYFVGGVGDFSVMLDQETRYLYFFVSQYASRTSVQGVSTARLLWANRDQPEGKVEMWMREDTWLPTRVMARDDDVRYFHPAGVPILRAADGWHDGIEVDAFWGPSVHYNTYLKQYVMLLNRAQDTNWSQEGIYVSFTARLNDPTSWSAPQRVLSGGRWYPQVVGIEVETGTDKVAGQRARFFMGGRSEHFIEFTQQD